MRKTISSKLMALVITIMLIVASLPMSMVSASAATDDYKLTVGIEPLDEYKKAKLDFLQAMESISKLSDL